MKAYQLVRENKITVIDGTPIVPAIRIDHIGYDAKSVQITAANGDMIWLWNSTDVEVGK